MIMMIKYILNVTHVQSLDMFRLIESMQQDNISIFVILHVTHVLTECVTCKFVILYVTHVYISNIICDTLYVYICNIICDTCRYRVCNLQLTMRNFQLVAEVGSRDKELYCNTHVPHGAGQGLGTEALQIKNAMEAQKRASAKVRTKKVCLTAEIRKNRTVSAEINMI